MTDNPQEPSFSDPEQTGSQAQESSSHAGEMDELRKKLTTESLGEKKPEERSGLFHRMTRPLTGAINRLRGTSSLGASQPTKSGSTGKLPPQELTDSDFERVLPPLEGPPSTEAAAPVEENLGSPEPDTFDLGFDTRSDLPFDTTLDDARNRSDYGYPPETPWPFDDSLTRPEEIDSSLPPEGPDLSSPSESKDVGSSSEFAQFLEKPAEPDKGRGWRSIVTDLLGRSKAEAPEQPSDYDLEDSILARRLGLSDTSGEEDQPSGEEDLLPGSAEALYGESLGGEEPPLYQPPAETTWYEQKPESEPEASEDHFADLRSQLSWETEETQTPTWPPVDEDWMQNLQAERESLLEDTPAETQARPAQDFTEDVSEDDPFLHRDAFFKEESYNAESVADFWDQEDLKSEQETEYVQDLAQPDDLAGELVWDEEETAEAGVEEDLSFDNMRDVALEEYEPEEAQAEAAAAQAEARGWLGLSRAEIAALAVATLLLMAIIAIGIVFLLNRAAPQPVQPTAVVVEAAPVGDGPQPTGIELTGGWYFALKPSTVVEGKWQPQGAEWLRGSEIRRVVALPWNRQLEAVVISLVPGDPISLSFNNSQSIVYQVDKVERITASSTSHLQDLSPSLLIVLALEDSTDRWLVTCSPQDKIGRAHV